MRSEAAWKSWREHDASCKGRRRPNRRSRECGWNRLSYRSCSGQGLAGLSGRHRRGGALVGCQRWTKELVRNVQGSRPFRKKGDPQMRNGARGARGVVERPGRCYMGLDFGSGLRRRLGERAVRVSPERAVRVSPERAVRVTPMRATSVWAWKNRVFGVSPERGGAGVTLIV